jgi:hypothetical protein
MQTAFAISNPISTRNQNRRESRKSSLMPFAVCDASR